MATQNFKRNLLLNLYREEKISVFFLLPLKRDKNVWHLQPLSSVRRPLAFLPVTLSASSSYSAILISSPPSFTFSVFVFLYLKWVFCRQHIDHLCFFLSTLPIFYLEISICCRKGDPFQGPKLGSCLTLGKELSEETRADKTRDFIGKGHPGGEQEGEGTRENCPAAWLAVLGFMVMGLVSGWSLANLSNSVFPGGARIAQPRWTLARGILGSGQTGSVSSRPFPNSSGWWWLISSVFFIRISCHKTTHADGYYGAWPGWAVSISVLPLTNPFALKVIMDNKGFLLFFFFSVCLTVFYSSITSLLPFKIF